eukprot:3317509-Pyramimonas_sp.AAC.1
MSNVTCYNRGKNGHEADRCWQKTRHGNDSKGTSKGGKGKKGKKGGKKDVNQMDEDWAEEGEGQARQDQPEPEEAGGLELCALAPPLCVIDSENSVSVNFDSRAAAAVMP